MALTDYGLLTLATLAVTLAAIYVATYIAYQAIRGLRRHDSKPMQYLSVGILLLFGLTYAVSFAGTVAFRYSLVSLTYQPAFRFLVRLLQLAGLGAVAYSLYLVRTEEPTLRATADGGRSDDVRSEAVPAGATVDTAAESPADASEATAETAGDAGDTAVDSTATTSRDAGNDE